MRNFFEPLRRPEGQDDLHWHVLPGQEAAASLAESYRELVTRQGLAPVPPGRLHVTVRRSVPAASVAPEALTQGLETAGTKAREILRPFDVRIRRPALRPSAVVCEVCPAAPLRALFEVTHGAFGGEPDNVPARNADGYHPRMSLAYGTAEAEDSPVQAWLDSHGTPEPLMRVDTLALVSQRWSGTKITWTLIGMIQLGTAGQPPP